MSVIATSVPVKAGKGLNDEESTIVWALVLVGVTSVWVPDSTAPPMLNFAGFPVMVKPGKVMVIGTEEALDTAENVTTSDWHDIPQPFELTDFTMNPERSPEGTPALTMSTVVEIVIPASSPLVAAPNVKPVIVTF